MGMENTPGNMDVGDSKETGNMVCKMVLALFWTILTLLKRKVYGSKEN